MWYQRRETSLVSRRSESRPRLRATAVSHCHNILISSVSIRFCPRRQTWIIYEAIGRPMLPGCAPCFPDVKSEHSSEFIVKERFKKRRENSDQERERWQLAICSDWVMDQRDTSDICKITLESQRRRIAIHAVSPRASKSESQISVEEPYFNDAENTRRAIGNREKTRTSTLTSTLSGFDPV
ncbi:hypothetical protein EAG_06480 [Camponotus floridanus]|uniref:Uncharacterized protein n=1 Tax=Camponotus floridanus TaxID=104421 RepID=E1ZYD9_CAMFO|nr:hypothetical protein EAG_06480 [Camponotus floridanus]